MEQRVWGVEPFRQQQPQPQQKQNNSEKDGWDDFDPDFDDPKPTTISNQIMPQTKSSSKEKQQDKRDGWDDFDDDDWADFTPNKIK